MVLKRVSQSIYYSFALTAITCVLCCAPSVFSQTLSNSSVPKTFSQKTSTTNDTTAIYESFLDYSKNQFVISIPFSKDNLNTLRKRRLMYHYRLIYLSSDDLIASKTGEIHIGFFSNSKEAEELKKDSSFIFPNQKIKHISKDEHSQIVSELNHKNTLDGSKYYVVAIGPETTVDFENIAQEILGNARNLFAEKRYSDAASHYRLLSFLADDSELSAWASELLGLSQEKQNLFADAIDTYKTILDQYPDASNIKRVRQRYLGLTTATSDKLEERKKSAASNIHFFSRGVFGQNYRNFYRSINDKEWEEILSRVVTDIDYRASARWKNHSLKARITGYNINDQLNKEDSLTRIKRLNLDYQHLPSGAQAQLGRIRDPDSGVFTPYDGVTLSYPILKNVHVSASAGLPVYFSDIYNDLDRNFLSTNISWDANKQWRFNTYLAHQTLNDVTDRSAFGISAHYFIPRFSSSLNIDYDYAFNELNNILWNSHLQLADNTQISAIYGNQRSPFLTSSNILIGQPDLDLDFYLSSNENRDNLLDDALERTSLNEYYTITITQKIGETLKLSFDYSHSFLSEIPDLETLGFINITDIEGSDNETFSYDAISARLVKREFLSNSDTFTLKVRGSRSDTSDSFYFYMSERIYIGKKFLFQPKFWFINSKVATRDANQNTWRLALSTTFNPWPATQFSLEAGGEHIDTGINDSTFGSAYIYAGYRIHF